MGLQRVVGQQLDMAYKASDKTYRLGSKAEDEMGRKFVFIQYEALAAAGSAGDFLAQCDDSYDNWVVSADGDNSGCVTGIPIGQEQVALTGDQKGWAQYSGPSRQDAVTDGNVVEGSSCVMSTATAGAILPQSGYKQRVGTARAADSGTTLSAGDLMLQIPL